MTPLDKCIIRNQQLYKNVMNFELLRLLVNSSKKEVLLNSIHTCILHHNTTCLEIILEELGYIVPPERYRDISFYYMSNQLDDELQNLQKVLLTNTAELNFKAYQQALNECFLYTIDHGCEYELYYLSLKIGKFQVDLDYINDEENTEIICAIKENKLVEFEALTNNPDNKPDVCSMIATSIGHTDIEMQILVFTYANRELLDNPLNEETKKINEPSELNEELNNTSKTAIIYSGLGKPTTEKAIRQEFAKPTPL